ncbi:MULTISPECIES: BhlA/UviB family holin-like peptide [Anaerotruncus]|uniref:BhlA/UviB family holin-like peptide n=1 Tax=Anaerotruncus TaxID=244127 RepID=UPI00345FE213
MQASTRSATLQTGNHPTGFCIARGRGCDPVFFDLQANFWTRFYFLSTTGLVQGPGGRTRTPLPATAARWEVNAMDMEFLKMFSVDGVWALLSVALIFYILKSQEKRDERQDQREQNYQQMILSLTETAKDITDVKQLLQDHLCAVDEKSPE